MASTISNEPSSSPPQHLARVVHIVQPATLWLEFGSVGYGVDRDIVRKISSVFAAMLSERWGKSGEKTLKIENDDLHHKAVEMILRSAHAESDKDMLQMNNVKNKAFLQKLATACDYFNCGYLVPDPFKQFLDPVVPGWKNNIDTDFLPSTLIAYRLGWADEVNVRIRFLLRRLSVVGEGEASDKVWIYHAGTGGKTKAQVVEKMDDFPAPLLGRLL